MGISVLPAQAVTLPWLSDPWDIQEKAAAYGANGLKPTSCPSVPASDHKLTLNEVVVASLCHNPATRAAYQELLASAAAYGSNYALYLPSVHAAGSYENNKIYNGGSSVSFRRLLGNGTAAEVTASMVLFDFGKREATLDAAEQALVAAGQIYDSTLQGMIASALQHYYRLLTSQNGVLAAEESEKFAKASYSAAQLRYKVGQVALADELQAKGSYSQAVLATQQANNQLLQDKAALAVLLGLAPNADIQVAEMDDSTLKVAPFAGKIENLINAAKEKRRDLAAQKAQYESAQSTLSALKRSDLPSVSASVGQAFDDGNIFSNSTARNQSIGVSVSIPIFSGFAQTYNERAAAEKLEAQKTRIAQTELSVQQDVWNAWNNYQTARQSWDTSRDLLDSATQLRDVSLGRYKQGLGSFLDVLNAQSQYSEAQQSQLKARYDLLTTRADLVRAVGVLNLETMRPEATIPGASQ